MVFSKRSGSGAQGSTAAEERRSAVHGFRQDRVTTGRCSGAVFRARHPEPAGLWRAADGLWSKTRTLGQDEDQGTRSASVRK